MDQQSPIHSLQRYRLIPVVQLADAGVADELTAALVAGGLPAIEITFRSDAARDAIANVARSHPDVLLAAGTVVSVEQAKLALDAGAKLIVSPGLNRPVIEYCLAHTVPCMPGVVTPTEIETARGYGLDTLKFFPAESFGGAATLKALSAVYGAFRFVPTGGINLQNLLDYLKLPTVLGCGGTWLTPKELIDNRRFGEISELARQAVKLAQTAART